MTAGDQHAVNAQTQTFENEEGVNSPRAGDLYYADISRIFCAAGASQVGTGIAAPFAEEAEQFRLPS